MATNFFTISSGWIPSSARGTGVSRVKSALTLEQGRLIIVIDFTGSLLLLWLALGRLVLKGLTVHNAAAPPLLALHSKRLATSILGVLRKAHILELHRGVI